MLESIAVHRLIAGPPAKAQYIGAAQPDKLEPLAAERVRTYVNNLANRREGQGRSQAAWWLDSCPAHIAKLLSCNVADFDTATRAALDALVATAKGKHPQSGVIMFVRSRDGETASLLCLKMLLGKEQLARFKDAVAADRAIHVEDIDNVLPLATDLKKAALIPHPEGDADLRVVDEQMDEPAGYWLEFLGARARRKEPETAKLTIATTVDVLRDQGIAETDVGKSVGESLKETIAGGKPETPEKVVRRIAKKAGVPPSTVWQQVVEKEAKLAEPEASISPSAAELQKTTITLGPGITVSGLSIYLDPRYDHKPAPPGEEGWIVELTSAVEPKVRHTIVTGRR